MSTLSSEFENVTVKTEESSPSPPPSIAKGVKLEVPESSESGFESDRPSV